MTKTKEQVKNCVQGKLKRNPRKPKKQAIKECLN